MKKYSKVFMIAAAAGVLMLSACGNDGYEEIKTEQSVAPYTSERSQTENKTTAVPEDNEKKAGDTMKMTVNGKTFDIVLEDNDTVSALKGLMPLTIEMSELNGNEKYYYLDTELPSASERVGKINEGDIMLYGDNCLVVFYDSFSTPYSYTKIGHVSDISGFADTLGNGGVTVAFYNDSTSYTESDLRDLSAFLHGKPAAEEMSGRQYDLNGDNSWDSLDLCVMRKRVIEQ